jgi:hypothetical protein
MSHSWAFRGNIIAKCIKIKNLPYLNTKRALHQKIANPTPDFPGHNRVSGPVLSANALSMGIHGEIV